MRTVNYLWKHIKQIYLGIKNGLISILQHPITQSLHGYCKNIESHIVPQHKVITLKPCLLYVWKQFFRLQCSIMIMNAIVLFISQLFFYVVFVCRFVLLKLRYDGTFNGPLLAQIYSTKKFPIERQLLKYLIIMMV